MFYTKIQALRKLKKKAFTVIEVIIVITAIAILMAGAFYGFQGIAKAARVSTMNSDLGKIRTAAVSFSEMSKSGTVPNGTVTVAAFTLDAANSNDGTTRKFLSGELKDPWGATYTIDSTARTVKCAGSKTDNVPEKTVEF